MGVLLFDLETYDLILLPHVEMLSWLLITLFYVSNPENLHIFSRIILEFIFFFPCWVLFDTKTAAMIEKNDDTQDAFQKLGAFL